jgi:hypothetical protein
MNCLLYSPIKLSRNLKLILCSPAKKDSISYFDTKKFYLIFLNTHKLKLFFDLKVYPGFFLGVEENFQILRKKKNLLKINSELNCYIFITDETRKKTISEPTFFKNKELIEKSIIYLDDRKKKLIKYL